MCTNCRLCLLVFPQDKVDQSNNVRKDVEQHEQEQEREEVWMPLFFGCSRLWPRFVHIFCCLHRVCSCVGHATVLVSVQVALDDIQKRLEAAASADERLRLQLQQAEVEAKVEDAKAKVRRVYV